MRRTRKIIFAIVGASVCASLVAVVPQLSSYSPEEVAYAQSKKKPKKPKTSPPGDFDAGSSLTARSEDSPPVGREKKEKDAGGGFTVETRGKGDAGSRVFRFGEIDIEGRLRSPQLVYFLRRVRAEFAAGDLGHRSFMRELSDTRHDPNFE